PGPVKDKTPFCAGGYTTPGYEKPPELINFGRSFARMILQWKNDIEPVSQDDYLALAAREKNKRMSIRPLATLTLPGGATKALLKNTKPTLERTVQGLEERSRTKGRRRRALIAAGSAATAFLAFKATRRWGPSKGLRP
ncbi:MAG: hypothetical protein IIA65_02355, partial [Planctomycetes bacterium]|nr:hypothetical protein [Planctomycetota bacterium]